MINHNATLLLLSIMFTSIIFTHVSFISPSLHSPSFLLSLIIHVSSVYSSLSLPHPLPFFPCLAIHVYYVNSSPPPPPPPHVSIPLSFPYFHSLSLPSVSVWVVGEVCYNEELKNLKELSGNWTRNEDS